VCNLVNGAAACACREGYTGNGKTCVLDVVPAGVGWSRVAGTHFTPVCEPSDAFFGFPNDCRNIFAAWSGGVADTARNRLLVTGGGHNDYYGNELYAFDLGARRYVRLNEPTPLEKHNECSTTALGDGRPASRHTYGGLTYLTHLDRMVLFGGASSCEAGGIVGDVWELDLAGLAASPDSSSYWSEVLPASPGVPELSYGGIIGASDYDPVTRLAVLYTGGGQLFSYDPSTRTTSLRPGTGPAGYHHTGVVDPDHRLFLLVGDDALGVFDLANGWTYTDLTSQLTGCESLGSQPYPGLAYDSEQKVVVGWAGGGTVYLIDLAARTCATRVFSQDAPGPQLQNGTHGRFRYFPSLRGFVLANDPDDDVYLLKLVP
jgi:hypothetical protein